MKLRNFFLAAAAFAGVFALAFTSCDKDDDDKVTNVDAIGLWKLDVDSEMLGSVGATGMYIDIKAESLGICADVDAEMAAKWGVSVDSVYCEEMAKVISIVANTDSAVVSVVGGDDTLNFTINRVDKSNYTMRTDIFGRDSTFTVTRSNMPVSYRFVEE